MGRLTVHLDRVSNIADKDVLGKTDPYVRFELKQDNFGRDHDYGFQRSSVKKNDVNPVYDETFVFNNIPTLNNMVLKVKILDDDIGSRDDKVGHCTIKLEDLGLSSSPMVVERVVDRNLISKNGRVHLKLSYDP
ncbi:C2 domain containing protein [Nitzschia inconspicua]|uniref:C2 domain containing protein n=1 Tax=Nitzschia inconspicua TaxID=303405 RepID=A0A9K3KGP5_9STRA|nr:C2 domain containing protein [Nitzschia inconspicua]